MRELQETQAPENGSAKPQPLKVLIGAPQSLGKMATGAGHIGELAHATKSGCFSSSWISRKWKALKLGSSASSKKMNTGREVRGNTPGKRRGVATEDSLSPADCLLPGGTSGSQPVH